MMIGREYKRSLGVANNILFLDLGSGYRDIYFVINYRAINLHTFLNVTYNLSKKLKALLKQDES